MTAPDRSTPPDKGAVRDQEDRYEASFERPVKAQLIVRLENGDEWFATAADLDRFRLVDPRKVYARFERWVVDTLGLERDKHITETVANPLRYAMECALNYDHMPDEDTAETLRRIQRCVSEHDPEALS